MWQKFSLRARINLLLALVLTLGLAANIARLVLEAGPRVQAEDQSVVRLAREFIDTIVTGLNEAPDAEARLNQIVHDLNRLRHVSITRQGEAVERSGQRPTRRQCRCTLAAGMVCHACSPRKDHGECADLDQGKAGFAADHVASERRDGRDLGWNYHPAPDRYGDCDRSLLITIRVVSRALAPIQTLSEAMTKIEAGGYDTRVKPDGPPELVAICDKLNHLAATLGNAVDDKRRLAERVVSLQDVERKEIARELHDEFGPYLFALRAHASALTRIADARAPNVEATRKHGSAILEQVNALQQSNRRVLEKLRPAG
jgi:two-component system sensor histidine kinase UhpB